MLQILTPVWLAGVIMSDKNVNVDAKEPAQFSDFDLLPEVLKAVSDLGYTNPTAIQEQAIGHLLEGRDILAVAQTGTGKTAAFALPLLSRIDLSIKKPQILVLAPTRELAIQVAEAFKTYGKNIKGFNVLPIYGGQAYRNQLDGLKRGPQVIVGTPGRVMDHISRKSLNLNDVKGLVLDEADEMLRMGFIDDVEWILERMSKNHQTALFSATMPTAIKRITSKYLKDPAEVMIKLKTTTAETITQRYWQLKNHEKTSTLINMLEAENIDAAIVFTRTKNSTIELAEKLQQQGYKAEALNGDIAQNQREKTVTQLKKGRIDILVATDVAARGLDVERISHVFNYDIPFDTESYVHRIGRTGRAGREGVAILLITNREKNMLSQIERATKQKIAPYKFPSLDEVNERKDQDFIALLEKQFVRDEYEKLLTYTKETLEVDDAQLSKMLLSLHLKGKAFYSDKQIQSMPQERSSNDRGSNDRNSSGRDKPRSDRSKEKHYDSIAMTSYRLAVGRTHGAQKGDIVGAIANEAGLSSSSMGKIYMGEEHSFIELPEAMPKAAVDELKKVYIRGQQINIEPGEPTSEERNDRGDRNDRGGEKSFKKRSPASNSNAGGKFADAKKSDKKLGNPRKDEGPGERKPRKRKAKQD